MTVGGLVDAHVHLHALDAEIGVEPQAFLRRGVVAVVDCGTFGVDEFTGARDAWKRSIPLRMFANLVPRGIRGPRAAWAPPPDDDGALERLRAVRPDGIKVRLGTDAARDDRADLGRAKRTARALGVPLMVHPTNARIDAGALLDALDDGDVLAHCFCGGSFSIVDGRRVIAAARAARERGVRFDLARGTFHFDGAVARAALADGFAPDFISTDATSQNFGRPPVVDLAAVVEEIVALGMAPNAALAAASTVPAAFYRLPIPAPGATSATIDERGRVTVAA